MEGSAILDEFSDGRGFVLWQSFRDVLLWAGADQSARRRSFRSGALTGRREAISESGLEGAPKDLVLELASLLLNPRGGTGRDVSTRVAARCCDLADWAVSVGATATAIAFARAAAEVCPREAATAFRVAQLATSAGWLTMARTWLARAISLGRRQGDWWTYASALIEMGDAALRRGGARVARLFYRRANHVAKRSGHAVLRGPAFHGRARAEIGLGLLDDAELHLRQALRAYGRIDPGKHAAQHDLAELLVRRGGDGCVAAVKLLRAVVPTRRTPLEQVESLTLLVRAAAAAQDGSTLEGAWFEAVEIVSGFGETADAGRMLLELAKATSAALDTRRQAVELVWRALRIGEATNTSLLVREAGAFLRARPPPRDRK